MHDLDTMHRMNGYKPQRWCIAFYTLCQGYLPMRDGGDNGFHHEEDSDDPIFWYTNEAVARDYCRRENEDSVDEGVDANLVVMSEDEYDSHVKVHHNKNHIPTVIIVEEKIAL